MRAIQILSECSTISINEQLQPKKELYREFLYRKAKISVQKIPRLSGKNYYTVNASRNGESIWYCDTTDITTLHNTMVELLTLVDQIYQIEQKVKKR